MAAREAVSLPIVASGHAVAPPGVETEVGEAPAALMAEQAVSVLIEYAEPAVPVPVSNLHGPSMHQIGASSTRPSRYLSLPGSHHFH